MNGDAGAAEPVEVRVTHPTDPVARGCLAAYFAELGERFDMASPEGRGRSWEPSGGASDSEP